LSKIFVDQIEPKTTNGTIKFGHKPYIVLGRLSATQSSLANNSMTKILFNHSVIDTDNAFDTANYRYLPSQHGYYEINVQTHATAGSGTNLYHMVRIRKNDADIDTAHLGEGISAINSVGSGGGYMVSANTIVELNGSTDYINFYHYHYDYTATTTVNLDIQNGNYFTAKLLKDL